MHGSITPASSGSIGPHPMHVTLNRVDSTQVNPESAIIQSRSISAPGQKDATAAIQQRISVSLSSDANHTRLTPDLTRSTLPFTGPKVNHLSLVPQAKVVSAQPGSSLKSGYFLFFFLFFSQIFMTNCRFLLRHIANRIV